LEFGEERSRERRECGVVVDGELLLLVSDLLTVLFAILGVAGDDFPVGVVVVVVSDKLVLVFEAITVDRCHRRHHRRHHRRAQLIRNSIDNFAGIGTQFSDQERERE
jgi:hypothetical protein